MKMLKQLTGMLLAAAAALFALPAAAHAAEGQPHILLNASGVEGQYILRLEEFGSRFESVQFAIAIDREVPAPQVAWEDDSPAHFQQVDTRSENGKTVLTVYIDRLRPIANSGSADLAALTFSQPLPAGAFSAEGGLLALDGNQEETLFSSPILSVSGVSAGDPTDPPASSSSSGGSSSGGSSSGGSSSGGSSSGSGSSGSGSSGSGSSGGSWDSEPAGGSPGGSLERTVLRWEDVSSGRTGETGGKKALIIRVSEGQVISSQIFLQAQRLGLLLQLDYGDYIWIFDTAKEIDIPSGRVFYDLSIKPLHFRNLSAAVQGSDLLQFEIAYSGDLPCPATLSCRAGSSYAGETVHLSYYNEKEASLDFCESAQVGEDGWVGFAFTHASRYVVSQRDFWSAPAQPAAGETAGAAVGTAASPVIVVPEDTLADAGQDTPEAEPEPEPEPEGSPSEPDEEPEEEPAAPAAGRDTRDNRNVIPLLILFLSAAAAAILLLQMYLSKKHRYRR